MQRCIEQLRRAEYPGDRTTAAIELGRLGPRARAAAQALLEATAQEGSYRLRAEAVKALGAIAPEDPAVLKRIADLLDYRAERGRLAATAQKTLEGIGPPAIPVLIEKLEAQWDEYGEDDILGTWGMAAPALGRIGRPALPAVLAAFEDPRRRVGAADALRVVGRAAAPEAVPVLIAHARDPDVHVRCMICSALEAMGPEAARRYPRSPLGSATRMGSVLRERPAPSARSGHLLVPHSPL